MSAAAEDPRLAIGGNNPPEPTLVERLTETYQPLTDAVIDVAERANTAPKKVADEDDLDRVGVIVKAAKEALKKVKAARTTEKEPYLLAGREVDGFFAVLADRLDRIVSTLEDRASDYQRAKAAEARRLAEEAARKAREREEAERIKAEEAAAAGRASTAAKAEDRAEEAAAIARRAERRVDATAADLARSRGASGTLATARTKQDVRIVDFDKVDLAKLRPYLDRDAVLKAARSWLRVTKGSEEIPGLEVFDDVKASFR